MDTQLGPLIQILALSAVGVCLIALSLLVSLAHLGLTSLLGWVERWLHAAPADQYLAYFALPLVATVLGGLVNVGTGLAMPDQLAIDRYQGLVVLAIVLVAAISVGVAAVRQLLRAREADPVDDADVRRPVSMWLAVADLKRRVRTLTDDVTMIEPKLLRLIAGRLERDNRKLLSKVDTLRSMCPAGGFASLRRGQLRGYAALVTVVSAGATTLAVIGSVVGVASGGGLLSHAAAGGLLAVLAIGLWSSAAAVRVKSATMRTRTLADRLTADLDKLSPCLDSIPEHARGIEVAIWVSNDDVAVGERLRTALGTYLGNFDIFEVDRGPTMAGLWLQRLTFRSTEFWRISEAMQEIERDAERRLAIELVENAQAALNRIRTSMVVNLIEALKDTEEACVLIGAIVLRKSAHGIEARTISAALATDLASDPDLLANPAAVAERLQAETPSTPTSEAASDSAAVVPPRPAEQQPAST